MKSNKYRFLTLLGTLIGVLSLLLFTTLVEDVFFKEVNFCVSTPSELALKTFAMLGAGSIVGFKSSLIVLRTNFWPHIVMSLGILVQLFLFNACPYMTNPIWFNALQSSFLIGGLWLGCHGAHKFPLAPV